MTPTITGLYVPGDRPDRFAKAFAAGADLVVLDLEDAVAPERREFARDAVAAVLAGEPPTPVVQVRIGSDADLPLLVAARFSVEVRVPKADLARLDHLADGLPGFALTALLEDPAAVLDARAIAAHPAVTRVGLGEADLRSAIGGGPAAIEFARAQLVFAAAAAGLPAPMLSAWTRLDDVEGLRRDTVRGAELGLVGRMAVHPRQLATIRGVFVPTAAEVAHAEAVLEALRGNGVTRLADGSMTDAAMRGDAERVLSLARHDEGPTDSSADPSSR